MRDEPRLLRLIAELDQQLAEAETGPAEKSQTNSEATMRRSIVNGLRAALADAEWQLAGTRAKRIGYGCLLGNRRLTWSSREKSVLCGEEVIINEFLAASDAELTLQSVLREMQSSAANAP